MVWKSLWYSPGFERFHQQAALIVPKTEHTATPRGESQMPAVLSKSGLRGRGGEHWERGTHH